MTVKQHEINEGAYRVLKQARNLLITDGWTRGSLEYLGTYCSLGAISKVVYDDAIRSFPPAEGLGDHRNVYLYEEVYTAAYRALYGVVGSNIAQWNDNPNRKLKQVVKAFDDAAEWVRYK